MFKWKDSIGLIYLRKGPRGRYFKVSNVTFLDGTSNCVGLDNLTEIEDESKQPLRCTLHKSEIKPPCMFVASAIDATVVLSHLQYQIDPELKLERNRSLGKQVVQNCKQTNIWSDFIDLFPHSRVVKSDNNLTPYQVQIPFVPTAYSTQICRLDTFLYHPERKNPENAFEFQTVNTAAAAVDNDSRFLLKVTTDDRVLKILDVEYSIPEASNIVSSAQDGEYINILYYNACVGAYSDFLILLLMTKYFANEISIKKGVTDVQKSAVEFCESIRDYLVQYISDQQYISAQEEAGEEDLTGKNKETFMEYISSLKNNPDFESWFNNQLRELLLKGPLSVTREEIKVYAHIPEVINDDGSISTIPGTSVPKSSVYTDEEIHIRKEFDKYIDKLIPESTPNVVKIDES